MLCRITVKRSEEWVKNARLVQCENVPQYVDVDVEVSDLSLRVRGILMIIGDGKFPSKVNAFPSSRVFEWCCEHVSWNRHTPIVDAEEPTTNHINSSILALDAKLSLRRTERIVKEREKKAEKDEKEAQNSNITEARELLKDELAALRAKCDKASADNVTLSGFINEIQQDVLYAALVRLVVSSKNDTGKPTDISDMMDKIENASYVTLFHGN